MFAGLFLPWWSYGTSPSQLWKLPQEWPLPCGPLLSSRVPLSNSMPSWQHSQLHGYFSNVCTSWKGISMLLDLNLKEIHFWSHAVCFPLSPSQYSLTVIYCAPIIGGVSMESCSSCPAGHYCSTDGLASPSGPCAAGFYCPFDFSSTTPYAFLCPKVRLNI